MSAINNILNINYIFVEHYSAVQKNWNPRERIVAKSSDTKVHIFTLVACLVFSAVLCESTNRFKKTVKN